MDHPNPNKVEETRPNSHPVESGGLQAPPKFLFYGCIGLFVLTVIGTLSGIFMFREVLRPAQQQRVIDNLPFMQAFMPPSPPADATIPTALAPVDQQALEDLLFGELDFSTGATTEVEAETAIESESDESGSESDESESIAPPSFVGGADEGASVAGLSTFTPTPTLEVQATATPAPTEAPQATATAAPPTQTPRPTVNVQATFDAMEAEATSIPRQDWPLAAINEGFRWEQQSWNNCGPATITMALSYYGWNRNQTYARERIRPNTEDRNTSPHELARFVNDFSDTAAIWRYGGDLAMARRLIAAGYPVIVERGHMFGGYEWLGHYQLLAGYDDITQEFTIVDSWLGQYSGGEPITETYEEVDDGWREFNRVFVVVFPPEDRSRVLSIIGTERATLEASAEHAAEVAQAELLRNQEDAHAWFNMGTSLTALGNYEQAAIAFDRATQLRQIRWRMYWYQFGSFEAYYKVGRYDDVLALVENNINNTSGGRYVEETYYWQGRVLAAQGDATGARNAFNQALRLNPNFIEAREALNGLG